MVVRPISIRAEATMASLASLFLSEIFSLVGTGLPKDSLLMTEFMTLVNDFPCIHLV